MAAGGGNIPLCNVAYALGVLQEWSRNQPDIAKCSSAKSRDNSASCRCGRLRGSNDVVQIGLRDWAVLFQIVFWIELLFVDWILTDNAIEEIAVARHTSARRNSHITFGIDQRVPFGVDRSVEVFGNLNIEAIQLPVFPFIGRKSEHRVPRKGAHHIQPHRIHQIFVQRSQHLKRFVNAHQPLFKSIVIAQRCYTAHMHTGGRSSAEVNRNTVGLLVAERGNEPLTTRRRTC